MNTATLCRPIGTSPHRHTHTPLSLGDIDAVLRQMWADEPECPAAERESVLDELRHLTIVVERLEFREMFHPDEATDERLVSRCADRLNWLRRAWPALEPDRPAA